MHLTIFLVNDSYEEVKKMRIMTQILNNKWICLIGVYNLSDKISVDKSAENFPCCRKFCPLNVKRSNQIQRINAENAEILT